MSEIVPKDRVWELERQVFQLSTLFEVAQTLTACRDSHGIYSGVLAILAGTFGAGQAVVFSRDNEDGRWRCVVCRGEHTVERINARLQEAGAFNFEQIRRHLDELFVAHHDHASAAVTFAIQEQSAGAFVLGPRLSGEPYSESDHELLKAVASYTAKALENLRLYEALREAEGKLRLENITLRQVVKKEFAGTAILGQSAAIKQVLNQVHNFANSEASVLIYGETGTGKELVARAIHYNSKRADGPFLGINCTAIPENLVEAEFFGIEPGTATGVKKHSGFFEQANGGTLFIDEVGDMPASLQAKLLRVLQERSLRRVGGDREIPVDVRVIAATNKDLAAMIRDGRFREDLYYRLGVLEIHIPPLRERREDIALLANHFVTQFAQRLDRRLGGLAPELVQALEAYEWPGNVRELENEIERLVIFAEEGKELRSENLSAKFAQNLRRPASEKKAFTRLRDAVDELEKQMIIETLEKFHGNKSRVARALGLSRLGLQRKMERLGIPGRSE